MILTKLLKRSAWFCFFAFAMTFAARAQQDSSLSYPEPFLDEDKAYRDSTFGLPFSFSEKDVIGVDVLRLRARLDSISRYNDSLLRIIKRANIAIRSDSLASLYNYIQKDRSKNYNSWNFSVAQNHATGGSLDDLLEKYGLPDFQKVSYDFSALLSFSWKRRRYVHELFMVIGVGRNNRNDKADFFYNAHRPINYSFGYSVLNTRLLDIFPFAGLSYQSSQLYFNDRTVDGFSPQASADSSLNRLFLSRNGSDFRIKNNQIVLDYGAEIDFHVVYSRAKTGMILGMRAGRTLPLVSSGWRSGDFRYSQLRDVRLKEYYFSFVIKIYWRRSLESYYLRYPNLYGE